MNLSFKVLGYEIWTLELELGEDTPEPPKVSLVDKAVGKVSKAWVGRMFR